MSKSTDDLRRADASPAVQPIVWMRALRDTVSGGRLNVLLMLALRMRKDGTGWAAQTTLAADAGVSVSTVARALSWAVEAGYLVRTRRGHRLNNDAALASEYRLTQPVTGDVLDGSEPSSNDETQHVISKPNTSYGQPNPSRVTGQGVFTKGSIYPSVPPVGGSPVGDLDDLRSENHTTPFQLGKRVAELCNAGVEVWPEQFRDLVLEQFGFEDERQAWAGLHQFRCKPRGECACHVDYDEVPA